MTGSPIDPDHHRFVAGLGVLQCSGELEGMTRHDAVVGITGGHQCGGVLGAFHEIVVRRIGVQRRELIGLFDISVVSLPPSRS